MQLYEKYGLDKQYCYNRKEKKDVSGIRAVASRLSADEG